MKILISFLLFLALTNAKPNFKIENADAILKKDLPSKEEFIVGGLWTWPHKYKYQAGLLIQDEQYVYFCGGTLISENYVLTAGHCIEGALYIDVVLGAHKIQESEWSQKILGSSEFILHDGYDPETLRNDIGLIKLPKKVASSRYIEPIALPNYTDYDKTFFGRIAVVSGWGTTSDASGVLSTSLRHTYVNINNNFVCELTLNEQIYSSQICTFSGLIFERGPCSGDAGGPVVVQNKLVGVISHGSDLGCEAGRPYVHTRVTKYLDWIKANTDVVINP